MTLKEFSKLAPGTRVRWEDDPVLGTVFPAGVLLAHGVPAIRSFVRWDDGQEIIGTDEAAVARIQTVKG